MVNDYHHKYYFKGTAQQMYNHVRLAQCTERDNNININWKENAFPKLDPHPDYEPQFQEFYKVWSEQDCGVDFECAARQLMVYNIQESLECFNIEFAEPFSAGDTKFTIYAVKNYAPYETEVLIDIIKRLMYEYSEITRMVFSGWHIDGLMVVERDYAPYEVHYMHVCHDYLNELKERKRNEKPQEGPRDVFGFDILQFYTMESIYAYYVLNLNIELHCSLNCKVTDCKNAHCTSSMGTTEYCTNCVWVHSMRPVWYNNRDEPEAIAAFVDRIKTRHLARLVYKYWHQALSRN